MSGSYRLEPIASVLRLYPDDDNSYEAHSVVEVNVLHAFPGVWIMSAHRGTHSRATLRALLHAAVREGVHTILAEREHGHKLPGAVHCAIGSWEGLSIDVPALASRLKQPV